MGSRLRGNDGGGRVDLGWGRVDHGWVTRMMDAEYAVGSTKTAYFVRGSFSTALTPAEYSTVARACPAITPDA